MAVVTANCYFFGQYTLFSFSKFQFYIIFIQPSTFDDAERY